MVRKAILDRDELPADEHQILPDDQPAADPEPQRSQPWRGAGGRWLIWAGRAVIWAVLLLIGYRGVLAIVHDETGTGAARSAPTTLPPSASRRSAVARPMPDAAPVTTNVRERARSALTIDGSSLESALSRGANLVAAQLESELVVNDAEPDLRYVHCHLLADERVLRAGIDVAERALESTALADRGGTGR